MHDQDRIGLSGSDVCVASLFSSGGFPRKRSEKREGLVLGVPFALGVSRVLSTQQC